MEKLITTLCLWIGFCLVADALRNYPIPRLHYISATGPSMQLLPRNTFIQNIQSLLESPSSVLSQKAENLKQRQTRELMTHRMRNYQQSRIPMLTSPQLQRHIPLRSLMNTKMAAQGSSPGLMRNQQYRPAYSVLGTSIINPALHEIDKAAIENHPIYQQHHPRPTTMLRGPLRLPGKVMTLRPQASLSQVPTASETQMNPNVPRIPLQADFALRQKYMKPQVLNSKVQNSFNVPRTSATHPVKQFGVPQQHPNIMELIESASHNKFQPTALNRPGQKNRVVEVYHHIPVAASANTDLRERSPAVVYISKPQLQGLSGLKTMHPEIYLNPSSRLSQSALKLPAELSLGPLMQPYAIPENKRPEIFMNNFKPLLTRPSQYSKEQASVSPFAPSAKMAPSYVSNADSEPVRNSDVYKSNGFRNTPQFNENRPLGNKADDVGAQRYSLGDNNSHSKNPQSEIDLNVDSNDSNLSQKQENFNQDHLESSDSNFHSKISLEDSNDDIPFVTTTESSPKGNITPAKTYLQHYNKNIHDEEETYDEDLEQIREFLSRTLPKQEVQPIPPRSVFNKERTNNYHESIPPVSLSDEFSKKSELTFNSLRKTTKMPNSFGGAPQSNKTVSKPSNSSNQSSNENFSPRHYTSSSPPPFRRYSTVTSNLDLTTTLSPQEAVAKQLQRATTVIGFNFYTTEMPKVTEAKTTPNESNLSTRKSNLYQNQKYRQISGFSTSISIQNNLQTTRSPQWNHGVRYAPSPTRSSHAFIQKAKDYTVVPTQNPTIVSTLDEASNLYTTSVPLLNATWSNYGNVEKQLQNLDKTIYRNQEEDVSSGISATVTSKPKLVKQYFRGPQHIFAFEDTTPFSTTDVDLTTTYAPSSTTLRSNVNSAELTSTPLPASDSLNMFGQQNVKVYSANSHAKVINALQLANKVFGRRNHTSKFGINTSTSTAKPNVQHKFTYAPTSYSTGTFDSENPTIARKLVFNFRTGTTDSISLQTSSILPNFNHKSSSHKSVTEGFPTGTTEFDFKLKTNNSHIIRNVSPETTFHTKLILNNSSNDNNMGLYKSLRPVTKPYNSPTVPPNRKLFNETIKFLRKGTSNVFDFRVIPSVSSDEISSLGTNPSSTLRTTNRPNRYPSYDGGLSSTNYSRAHDIQVIGSHEASPETVTKLNSKDSTTDATLDNYVNQTEDFRVNVETTRNAIQKATTSPSDDGSRVELTTELAIEEQAIVESFKSMKVKMQEMMSKGFRHLMPMFMGLSSDVSVSNDCTFSLLRWLRGIKSMEQWAVQMMDASSKIPEGILYGTFSTFGSYDECIGIKTPNLNMQAPYRGQYCSINIQPVLPENERHFTIQNAFRKYPKLKQIFQEMNIEEDTMAYYYILKHRIGVCMPSTCSIEDLGNVTEKLADQLKMKITVGRCETSEKPRLTKGQIISMCGVFIMFGIVVVATIIDMCIRFRTKHEMDLEDIIRKKSVLRQFSYVFSAYGNACRILNTSLPVTHLSSLHGIKFLSITWVMLGHVYYCKDYLTLAGLNKVRDLGANLAFQVVLNSAFAADTFFFLSGLLVVYTAFSYLELNNGHFSIVGFYVRRYCRLTPAFLMISGVILLGPLAGSGPIWHETLEPFVSGCQSYWWTNLFYFSNFIPTSKTCVPHGWFLSCDMQFYIISPVIILALYRKPKIGMLLIVLGILTSMATTGCLTFMYNLPPVSLFSLPDPKDINEYLNTIGYKPYAHYAAYCVGMATGFLLAAKEKISVTKSVQIFGWVSSTVTCLLVIYGTWNWNSGELPDWKVSVAYATSSRTIWSLGVAWLVIVCYSGHGGIVNDILSWHGFVPLSRLSYLAYLIHPLLMYLYASYVRSPFYFSQYVVVYLYLSHLCVTFGLAFLFSLAFELPFLNLEKVFSSYLDQSKRKRRASFSLPHSNWLHPEHPELKDSVVLMRRRPDRFVT